MREIKFGCWDKSIKKMVYFHAPLFHLVGQRIEFQAMDKINQISETMQYTGLKDKNGKEIYEGDVIELIYAESDERKRGYVIYHTMDAAFAFDEGSTITALAAMTFDDDIEFEIIGNIYENPELLKEKEKGGKA